MNEAKNGKQRLDEHDKNIAMITLALDRLRRDNDETRNVLTREITELATRLDALESKRWAVRLNEMVRKVWR